jgi:purine nucleosidase
MSQRKILIDTDTGIDDALAILVTLADPAVDVIGIGATYGNCRTAQAARNALCVLEVAGTEDVPVAQGEIEPSSAEELIAFAAPVHGQDGLGDTGLRPAHRTLSGEGAVEQLLRVAQEAGGETDLLTLGPLTNLAAALRRDRAVLSRFHAVVVMGGMGPAWLAGTVLPAYPGYLSVGDPNVRHNREAAEAVARTEAAITWVGMNVTGPLLLPAALLDDLAAQGSPRARFVRAIHRVYVEFVTQATGSAERVFTVHDTTAAAVLLDPGIALESVDATPALVRDETGRGGVWGQAPKPDAPAHRFVTKIDGSAIERRIRHALAPAPASE